MKNTLKTFPESHGFHAEDKYQRWKEAVEAELKQQLLERALDAMVELVDDRSDFQKGWKIGYADAVKKVLGEDKEILGEA